MGRKVVQHRIFDLTLLLLVIAIVTSLRVSLWPTEAESVRNVVTPIGEILQSWQGHIPVLSVIIWGVALMGIGLGLGRLGVRYSIYPAYTLMAIPLFGITACAVVGSTEWLLTTVATFVMYLATRAMTRFIMRTERFGDLSLAMLYFGLLPLVFAPTAILYVALPLLVLFVRSSWRDVMVALGSLLLPPFAVCYWHWCAGGDFISPMVKLYAALFTESGYYFFSSLNFATIALLGIIVLMVFCAVALLVSDRYAIKSKSRAMLRFNALLIPLFFSLLFLPSATATLYAIVAIPLAMLVPLFFVRMGMGITELCYRLMLLAAAVNVVLMAF